MIIHLCALYVQLISTFCSTRRFPLRSPRGHSVISHLKFGTTYPSILGFAQSYQPSNVISKRTYSNSIYTSLPASSSPSDCLRLRFSMFADIVHLTNACIIITGSIARSANLPVFSLLRGWFWGFSPRRVTHCTDGGEIWHGGGTSMPNFTPVGATTRV